MSGKPLTPTRKKQLEAYYKCVLRAEKRIVAASHIARGARGTISDRMANSPRVAAMAGYMKAGQWERYAVSLGLLRLARSKFAAELEGLPWR